MRRAFSYRGARVRRRMRRLVRLRFFNNACTVTSNLTLPLAIGDFHLFTAPRILASTWRPHGGLFWHPPGAPAVFIWVAIFGQGADMDIFHKPLNLLDSCCP